VKRKKIIGIISLILVAGAGLADAIRYLQPDEKNKIKIQQQASSAPVKELIFVYNANGGIFPGIADFVHKEFFPSSYPCNLCYLTFGTFKMKKEWKDFLATLPVEQTFYHKDVFKRKYDYTGDFPVVLFNDKQTTGIFISKAELDRLQSLQQLIYLVNQKPLQLQ